MSVNQELKADRNNGYVKKELYYHSSYLELNHMIDFPKGYCRFIGKEYLQLEPEAEEEVKEKIRRETLIYIYGAGKVGQKLENYLHGNFINSKINYIVTEVPEADQQVGIYGINDEELDLGKLIIIAVKNLSARTDMYIRAAERGFETIMILENDFINLL